MKIGEVSKELDIPSATLRYYEHIGLLENIKKKSELELFCDFYKSQNNIDLDANETEIINNIISEVKHETN